MPRGREDQCVAHHTDFLPRRAARLRHHMARLTRALHTATRATLPTVVTSTVQRRAKLLATDGAVRAVGKRARRGRPGYVALRGRGGTRDGVLVLSLVPSTATQTRQAPPALGSGSRGSLPRFGRLALRLLCLLLRLLFAPRRELFLLLALRFLRLVLHGRVLALRLGQALELFASATVGALGVRARAVEQRHELLWWWWGVCVMRTTTTSAEGGETRRWAQRGVKGRVRRREEHAISGSADRLMGGRCV